MMMCYLIAEYEEV